MAAYFRNNTWQEDIKLKEDFKKYVSQGLQRNKILNFQGLSRIRMEHADSRQAVTTLWYILHWQDCNNWNCYRCHGKELDGPGQLLGYWAMHQKLRQEYGINVPRDLVYATMQELDPEGLERHKVGIKNQKRKECFITRGLGPFCWWTQQTHGVSKWHLSPCSLWQCWHSQQKTSVALYLDDQ